MMSAVLESDTNGLTEAELKLLWSERNFDEGKVSKILEILREADLVRFAPALADKQATRQLLERTKAAITDLSNLRTQVTA
jgi:hypothetical protein